MRQHLSKILPLMIVLCCVLGFFGSATAKDYLYIPTVNALDIIDCETDTIVKTIPYNDYILHSMPSADGKRYYLNAFHSIYAVDTVSDTIVDTYKFASKLNKVDVLGFSVSQDGKRLYLSCSITKKKQDAPRLNVLPPQLVVYDMQTRKIVKNYQIPGAMNGVVTLRNDKDNIFLVGLDIHKLNLKNGKLTKVMGVLNPEKGEEQKNALVIWQNNSPGDHGLFTSPFYTATAMGYFVIDKNTGKLSTLMGKDIWFEYSTIVTPDKKHMFGVMDELIKIDFKTGETVKAVSVKQGTCYVLSMTSDGKKIYAGPAGADISVYDTETLELLGVIALSGDGVSGHRITKN